MFTVTNIILSIISCIIFVVLCFVLSPVILICDYLLSTSIIIFLLLGDGLYTIIFFKCILTLCIYFIQGGVEANLIFK